MAKRTNLSLDESAADLLGKVGNASEYVSRLVQHRWREWSEAIATLRSAGWDRSALKAACDALNGYWMIGHGRQPSFVALELADAEDLNGTARKWDVNPARWTELIGVLRERADLAQALCVAVEEFWLNNEACESAIERS